LGVVAARAVGKSRHADQRLSLAPVALHVANQSLAGVCPCSWIIQALLGSGDLLLDTSGHPPSQILLERAHNRPEEAMDRRDVEEIVVADITPYLANRDIRVGD